MYIFARVSSCNVVGLIWLTKMNSSFDCPIIAEDFNIGVDLVKWDGGFYKQLGSTKN